MGLKKGRGTGGVPLFNNIVQNLHHGHCLLLRETFFLQPLDKAEGVKVVITLAGGGRGKGASLVLRETWWAGAEVRGETALWDSSRCPF